MKRLCGVNPPVITIFDEHHKVDIEASKRQADFLISKGVDGLAYLGTSGEFSIMTVEEKKNFINEMIEKCRKGKCTPEQAAAELFKPCMCGIFNTDRAAMLIRTMIEAEK